MGATIIVLLAVLAEIVCIVVCAKAIAKDVRVFLRRLRLLRWASKMLELSRAQEANEAETARCSIIQFRPVSDGLHNN